MLNIFIETFLRIIRKLWQLTELNFQFTLRPLYSLKKSLQCYRQVANKKKFLPIRLRPVSQSELFRVISNYCNYAASHVQVFVNRFGQYIIKMQVKVKWPRYRSGVAQRVGRGIALLFYDLGTRRGWVVSVTPWPYFTHGKDPVPILQEAGWAPGSVWTGAEKLAPTGIRSPDRPARCQSLYRLSYPLKCRYNYEMCYNHI
jgi:hypothetical protein